MLDQWRERVNEELQRYFDDTELDQTLREFTMRGGKRLRPILAIAGYTCFHDDDHILPAALATEFLHSSLLIHDDIIDRSDTRRGKDTVHERFDDPHEGLTAAILTGDLASHRMYRPILDSDFSPGKKLEAIRVMQEIAETECTGEWLDSRDSAITEEAVLEIYEKKTAMYTTVGPLRLGAVLAGEPEEKFDDLALDLGIAFQILDDINGVFGAEGKPSEDIEEGAKTLLYVETLKRCDDEEQQRLERHYDTDATKPVEALFQRYGVEPCRRRAAELLKNARSLVQEEWRGAGRELLQAVIDRVAEL